MNLIEFFLIVITLTAFFAAGLICGLSEQQEISAHKIEYALEACSINGGLKHISTGSAKCSNGAVFELNPINEDNNER